MDNERGSDAAAAVCQGLERERERERERESSGFWCVVVMLLLFGLSEYKSMAIEIEQSRRAQDSSGSDMGY